MEILNFKIFPPLSPVLQYIGGWGSFRTQFVTDPCAMIPSIVNTYVVPNVNQIHTFVAIGKTHIQRPKHQLAAKNILIVANRF